MERAGVEFFKKNHPKVKRVKEILTRAAREARGARLKRAKRASGGPGSPRLFSRQRGNFFEIKKFLQLKIVKNARGRVHCLRLKICYKLRSLFKVELLIRFFNFFLTNCSFLEKLFVIVIVCMFYAKPVQKMKIKYFQITHFRSK